MAISKIRLMTIPVTAYRQSLERSFINEKHRGNKEDGNYEM
jgi:hypothetical protein